MREALHAFDEGSEAFAIAFTSPATLPASLAWDPATGDPDAGSLSLEAEFNAHTEQVILGIRRATALDLDGKVLTARVRVDRDPALTNAFEATQGTPDPAAGVKLYVVTGSDSRFVAGYRANFVTGGWIPLVLDLGNPGYVDGGDVSAIERDAVWEFGIDVDTAEAGVFTTGALHVDTFAVENGSIPSSPPWPFDCGTEGFSVAYLTHGSLVPTLAWEQGALRLDVAIDGPSQQAAVGYVLGTPGLDLSGRTLSGRVRWESDEPNSRVSANFYVASGSRYVCGIGPLLTLDPGEPYTRLTLPVDIPGFVCTVAGASYDSSQVPELGVAVTSDVGGSYAPGSLYIDEVAVE